MSIEPSRIAQNYTSVRAKIEDAAARSGRQSSDVQLVAVTKYVGPEEAQALVDAGCHDLGESRPQELWHKAEQMQNDAIRWHMIGHLQRNKVKRTLPLVACFHSLDSRRLLREVNAVAGRADRRVVGLLEVNISGDQEKHGFQPSELPELMPELSAFEQVEIRGLMAMASREGGVDVARRDFIALRELRDSLVSECPATVQLHELSMGMSGDFEAAIEEGATIVRVGSALFVT